MAGWDRVLSDFGVGSDWIICWAARMIWPAWTLLRLAHSLNLTFNSKSGKKGNFKFWNYFELKLIK